MSSSEGKHGPTKSLTSLGPPSAGRLVKKVPSPRQDELNEKRRSIFLRKVRDGREDKRFEARAEDMMRLDFLQRQHAWETQLAKEAPQLDYEILDEEEDVDTFEYDLPSSSDVMHFSTTSTQRNDPDDELDEVQQREALELEALLEYMPQEAETDRQRDTENMQEKQNMWSDDDDYEELFSAFMEQEAAAERQAQGATASSSHDAMDMS